MLSCSSCRRLLLNSPAVCPFCGAAQPEAGPLKRVAQGVLTAAMPMLLAACYGVPPKETGLVDVDGDGYDTPADCDDEDETVNPDAAEDCDDGVDNNCNGVTDGDDEACTDTAT